MLIDNYLGNPFSNLNRFNAMECGIYPFYRKEPNPMPAMNYRGVTEVIFNLCNPTVGNELYESLRGDVWSLDSLVNAMRKCPTSSNQTMNYLLLKSKNESPISPDSIKKVIFVLILNEILHIGYNKEKNCAMFSLAHSNRLSIN